MPVFSSVLSDAKEPLQTQTLRTHREVCILLAGISISIACDHYASDHYPCNHSFDHSARYLSLRAPFDAATQRCYDRNAGWSSLVARWAHNPKVGGSNPPPATNSTVWFQWVEPISRTDSTTLNPDPQPIFQKLFTQRFTQTRSARRF